MEIVDNKVRITVGQFIENIRANGFPKTFRYLFKYDNDLRTNEQPHQYIKAACAFGQGLINSKAYFNPYYGTDVFVRGLYDVVWSLNDDVSLDLSLEQIADELQQKFSTQLDRVIVFDYFDYTPFLPVRV